MIVPPVGEEAVVARHLRAAAVVAPEAVRERAVHERRRVGEADVAVVAREEAVRRETAAHGGIAVERPVGVDPCAHEKAVAVAGRAIRPVAQRTRAAGDVVGDDAVHKDDARPPVRHVDTAAVIAINAPPLPHFL